MRAQLEKLIRPYPLKKDADGSGIIMISIVPTQGSYVVLELQADPRLMIITPSQRLTLEDFIKGLGANTELASDKGMKVLRVQASQEKMVKVVRSLKTSFNPALVHSFQLCFHAYLNARPYMSRQYWKPIKLQRHVIDNEPAKMPKPVESNGGSAADPKLGPWRDVQRMQLPEGVVVQSHFTLWDRVSEKPAEPGPRVVDCLSPTGVIELTTCSVNSLAV
jgi:hypothetical protein